MINLNSVLEKNEVIEQKSNDQIFIIPIKNGLADMTNICSLSNLSFYIWGLIDYSKTVNDIIISVVANYDIDYETAKRDILDFLNTLIKENVIRAIQL